MSMRQADVRVIATLTAKTLNHRGHRGSQRKPHAGGVRGIPTFVEIQSWRSMRILAWHLRDGARGKAFEEPASACGIVFLVGREDDQEETIFRRGTEARDVED